MNDLFSLCLFYLPCSCSCQESTPENLQPTIIESTSMSRRVVLFLLHNVFWFLLNSNTCYGVESDIQCLKTLKIQLKDPNNYFSPWDFNNSTEGFICKFNGIECWKPDENEVLNIRLSNMGLQGQFPSGLKNCKSLVGLDLSNNDLSGSLPADIEEIIRFVTALDLSFNKFSGLLPSELGNLTYLNVLNLEHNQFTGPIPWQLGRLNRLATFSVADNSLSGQIPTFTTKIFPAANFANNSGLCGTPLNACKARPKRSLPGVIIGAALGGILFGGLVVAALTRLICRVPKQQEEEEDVEGNKWAKSIKGTKSIKVSMFEKSVPKMRLFNLMKATNNFSKDNIIGSGRTGTMYKAALSDGSVLAVKRLQELPHSDKHFISEITALASIRHCNLVPLSGLCIAQNVRLLVYEFRYMLRGTLYDQLHHLKSKTMDLAMRLRIGIGMARGLVWLHHHCNPCIIHRHLSSKCILLDEDFEPKISDYGFARLMNQDDSHLTVTLDSNFDDSAYLAPEYTHTLVATLKGDVYSFGMVLLELVTGKTPAQVKYAVRIFKDVEDWVAFVVKKYAKDKSLMGRWCEDEIVKFLNVAFACVASNPEERLTMLEVYRLLRAVDPRCGFIDEDGRLMPSDNLNLDIHRLDEVIVAQEIQEIR